MPKASKPAAERSSERFYCPFPGCTRSFAELWRLKVHYRAPPDVRGSGKERGHGQELDHCPRCHKDLVPGKHHVGCSGRQVERPPDTGLQGFDPSRLGGSELPGFHPDAFHAAAAAIKAERQHNSGADQTQPSHHHFTAAAEAAFPTWAPSGPSLFSSSSHLSSRTGGVMPWFHGMGALPERPGGGAGGEDRLTDNAANGATGTHASVHREPVQTAKRSWAHCSVQTDLSGLYWPLDEPFPRSPPQQVPLITQDSATGPRGVDYTSQLDYSNARHPSVFALGGYPHLATLPALAPPPAKRARSALEGDLVTSCEPAKSLPAMPPLSASVPSYPHYGVTGATAGLGDAFAPDPMSNAHAADSADAKGDGAMLHTALEVPVHCSVNGGKARTAPVPPPMEGFLPGGDLMFDFAQFCEFDLMAAPATESSSALAAFSDAPDFGDCTSPDLETLEPHFAGLDDDVFQILFEDNRHHTTSITTHMHRRASLDGGSGGGTNLDGFPPLRTLALTEETPIPSPGDEAAVAGAEYGAPSTSTEDGHDAAAGAMSHMPCQQQLLSAASPRAHGTRHALKTELT